jgi:septal ring factor EnvC (AmiA/AmiB activator)
MARKSKISTDNTNNELGLSDLRMRLNSSEKENSKLIKQIESNRTKLNNFNDSIKEVGIQIAQRVAPFRQKMLELDKQLGNYIWNGRSEVVQRLLAKECDTETVMRSLNGWVEKYQ